jgi:hypothetical protein
MTGLRISPLSDSDRWAVIASLAARRPFNDLTHRRLQAAVMDAELQMQAEEDDPFKGLSRVGWRFELADRAAAILRRQT